MANYVLLERIELNASAASVTFSNIPQTGYTDLKVVASTRSAAANAVDALYGRFNSSSTGYTNRILYGETTGVGSFSPSISYAHCGYGVGGNGTANTFSNLEIYIPNYTSSNNKSVSVDAVTETNATTAQAGVQSFEAALWANSAAITSITFTQESGNSFVANSTFSLYGLAAVGTTPVIAPKASGGNRIDYDGTYWIHTFNTSGTFTPQTALSCDYLVVAGGGGGGGTVNSSPAGGGGGAGGFLTSIGGSALSLSATGYTVTVGAGGAGGTTSGTTGSVGSNSIFSSITSTGGGGGAGYGPTSPTAGGSGGGAAWIISGTSVGGAASPSGQGNAGGTAQVGNNYQGGAGGGGASAAGTNNTAANNNGTTGGAGSASSITGSSVTYAGGGGGGGGAGTTPLGTGAAGGAGGGGAGGNSDQNGTAGTVNLGGGGGGSGYFRTGGAGGSGIVIIRYLA